MRVKFSFYRIKISVSTSFKNTEKILSSLSSILHSPFSLSHRNHPIVVPTFRFPCEKHTESMCSFHVTPRKLKTRRKKMISGRAPNRKYSTTKI